MSLRYALKRFTDGATDVFLVVDPDSDHPLTNGDMMPWQSISPNLLRCMMASVMPDAVEVAPTSEQEATRFTE